MKNMIILIVISVGLLSAQSSTSDTPTLSSWRGGTVNFSAGIGLNLLGPGSGSASAGGVLSPRMQNRAASVFYNPAELATMRISHVMIDSRLGVGTELLGLEGSALVTDKMLSEQTDTFLKDSSIFLYDKVNGFKRPTTVNAGAAGLNGQLTSFSVALPVATGIVLGFGSYYPIDLAIGFRVSDMSMKLRATRETGNQTIGIDILLNMALSTNLLIRSNVLSVGGGFQLMNTSNGYLSAGIAAKRYDVRTVLDFDLPMQGLIAIQKSEYYFNNPDDPAIDFSSGETNKLFWKAYGDFRDEQWGGTVGLYYNATRLMKNAVSALNVSLVFDKAPSFSMDDRNARSESYSPVFLVGKPGGTGKDSMQILIDSLKLSKPSLTKATNNVFSQSLSIRQASSLTVGLDVGLGQHTIALNYIKFFGDFAMTFDRYHIRKKLDTGIKAGVSFAMPDRLAGWNWLLLPVRLLYLDFDGMLFQAFQSSTGYQRSFYSIGGGIVTGTGEAYGMDPDMAKSLRTSLGAPLPTGFTLGRQYTVFTRYTIGVLVIGMPDLAFKTSLGILL